jgi:hypothetical protein
MTEVFLVVREKGDFGVFETLFLSAFEDAALKFSLGWMRDHSTSVNEEALSVYSAPVDPDVLVVGHQLTEVRAYSNYDDGGLKLEPGVWVSGA